jgi:hypothetical protein
MFVGCLLAGSMHGLLLFLGRLACFFLLRKTLRIHEERSFMAMAAISVWIESKLGRPGQSHILIKESGQQASNRTGPVRGVGFQSDPSQSKIRGGQIVTDMDPSSPSPERGDPHGEQSLRQAAGAWLEATPRSTDDDPLIQDMIQRLSNLNNQDPPADADIRTKSTTSTPATKTEKRKFTQAEKGKGTMLS